MTNNQGKGFFNQLRLNVFFKFFPFFLMPAVFFVFMDSLPYGFLTGWDDYSYVVNNESVMGWSRQHVFMAFTRIFVGNYAPIHILSYTLDYSLWGLNAAGFRFSNVLIHAVNSVLVFLLVFRLGGNRMTAAIASAIFSIHPLQVESVVWISQRKNVLSLFFFLLSFILYLEYIRNGKRVNYAGSLMMFFFSLLTKSVAVVLPFIILLFHFSLETSGKERKWIRNIVPYGLLGLLFSYITIITQTPDLSGGINGGGIVPYHGGSPYATFLTMIPVLVKYSRMVLFPFNLSALYSPPIYTGITWEVMTSALILILLILTVIYAYKYNKFILFWTSWSFICLLPVMQFVPLVTIMNDRYLYFPMVGLSSLMAYLISSQFQRTKRGKARLLLAFCIGMGGILLGTASIERSKVWRDSLSLWKDAVDKSPDNATALSNLGASYMELGLNHEAMQSLKQSISINPQAAAPYGMLSTIFLESKEFVRAETNIRKAIALQPSMGRFHAMLGDVYFQQSRSQEAWSSYRDAVDCDEGLLSEAEFRQHLDQVSNRLRFQLEKNISKDPNDLTSRFRLGDIYLTLKDYNLAQKTFEDLLKLNPAHIEALNKTAFICLRQMQMDKAEELLKKVIAMDSQSGAAHMYLGILYFREDQIEKSREHLEKALRLTRDPIYQEKIRKILQRLK